MPRTKIDLPFKDVAKPVGRPRIYKYTTSIQITNKFGTSYIRTVTHKTKSYAEYEEATRIQLKYPKQFTKTVKVKTKTKQGVNVSTKDIQVYKFGNRTYKSEEAYKNAVRKNRVVTKAKDAFKKYEKNFSKDQINELKETIKHYEKSYKGLSKKEKEKAFPVKNLLAANEDTSFEELSDKLNRSIRYMSGKGDAYDSIMENLDTPENEFYLEERTLLKAEIKMKWYKLKLEDIELLKEESRKIYTYKDNKEATLVVVHSMQTILKKYN